METKRILYCTDILGLGGVERRRLSLSKYLLPKGYEIKIICSVVRRYLYRELEELGVEIIQVGTMKHPFDWSVHRQVQQVIESYRPHIIHGAVFEGVTMAAINGAIKRVPIVILEETSDPVNRSRKADLLIKFFSLFADCFVGVSEASTNYLKKKAHVKSSKIKLINNGVKPPRNVSQEEISALKKEWGVNEGTFLYGSVGRMADDSHKRFSDLFRAFQKLVQKGYPVKLIMVGDGELRADYEKQVQELGIQSEVIFAGYHEDTAKFYAMMDVFTLTSGREAFGLVLAEAMFFSKPVVATRVGGMQYIVEDGETGFLVEKFEVAAIAEALEKLYIDQEKAVKMGEAGYQRTMENYTEDIYVKNVEQLYLALAQKKGLA